MSGQSPRTLYDKEHDVFYGVSSGFKPPQKSSSMFSNVADDSVSQQGEDLERTLITLL